MDYSGFNVNICRNLIDDEIFQKPELLQLFLHGLMKASPRQQIVDIDCGRKVVQVELHPGQWIYSREKTAKELGQNSFTTYKRMKAITSKLKIWNTQRHTYFSVVTICNWDAYKAKKSRGEHPREHPKPKKGTPIKTFKTMTRDDFKKDVYENGKACGLMVPQMKNFFEYWTEPGPSGMMRFQYEKTWEIKRRMATFLRMDAKHGFTKQNDDEVLIV